ncbi:MAG: bifunctional diguanylate cyclase/phosphodiesterase [Pseudomonadota bacterium]
MPASELTLRETIDPYGELAAAACNLLADCIGARYCAMVAFDGGETVAVSSEFMGLPLPTRRQTIATVVAAVQDATFETDAPSSQMLNAKMPESVGSTACILFFPETEIIVFAVPAEGRTLPVTAFRRAALSALPIVYRTADLRTERTHLRSAHQLLSHVEELAKIGGWEQVIDTGELQWSQEVYEIHGLEPGAKVDLEQALKLYPSPAREKLRMEMERVAAEDGEFDLTTPIKTPAGEERIVRTVGRSHDGPSGRRFYGTAQDVTRQLSTEKKRWWAANHDPVTSLPNRLLFEDRIAVAVRRARREGRSFALLVIEIADFARLSEHTGYTLPDKHMLDVASRLADVTRDSDTIARVSINEFAFILSDVDTPEAFVPAMARLEEQFNEMQRESGGDGVIPSAGVAFFPMHAEGPDELMRAAEMALGRARRKLDQPVVIFDRPLANDVEKRRETVLERARDSLEKGEFVPYYQAQFDMETKEITGVEALVRWQKPEFILDAKDFAYALDDHEIGSRVGRAVLDAVIADIAKLRSLTTLPFRVSVNASRTEVLRNDFLDTFLEKTRSGNLKPNDFIIEITEDVIIGVDDRTLHDKVSYLASSGVEFSLDDFGTGYASLIHITSFPIKEIKIDKQFISGIQSDRRKRAIVRGIMQIAQSMGLNVIAEGVETAQQQEVLREIGCRHGQGYLFSFPVPFVEFAAMLDQPR